MVFRVRGGVFCICDIFEIKITLDYQPKKSKIMLDIIVAFWEKIDLGSGGVLWIYGSFWDQNHSWLSAKKLEKILDIRGTLGGGGKPQLIIGQERFEIKNQLSVGRGVLSKCGIFWDPNHNWFSEKKSGKCLILHFLTYLADNQVGWVQNWISVKKVKKILDNISRVLRKKSTFRGSWAFVALLGSKSQLIIGQQSKKKCSIL